MARMCVICSRVQVSKVTDLLGVSNYSGLGSASRDMGRVAVTVVLQLRGQTNRDMGGPRPSPSSCHHRHQSGSTLRPSISLIQIQGSKCAHPSPTISHRETDSHSGLMCAHLAMYSRTMYTKENPKIHARPPWRRGAAIGACLWPSATLSSRFRIGYPAASQNRAEY